jgi:hypothetical protein
MPRLLPYSKLLRENSAELVSFFLLEEARHPMKKAGPECEGPIGGRPLTGVKQV